jgi:DNA-binding transcriptional MerR regulator
VEPWRKDLLLELNAFERKLLRGKYLLENAAWKLQMIGANVATAERQRASESPPEPKAPTGSPEAREVFEFWRGQTKRSKARATPGRLQKIQARLDDGFSVEQLKKMIAWSSCDPHHQGQNDREIRYDTIETLFRSTERTERFCERAKGAQGPLFDVEPEASDEIKELEDEGKRAKNNGDIDRYNEIQDELRALVNREGDR